jgi:hypothetical protein
MRRFARENGLARWTALSRAVALLAALVLVVAPNLDIHRAQQAEASFGGDRTVISEGASHPTAPLHVEASPQTEEEPCAFCLFSGQIGNGLLGAPIPQPHLEVRTAALAVGVLPVLAAARPTLPSRAPPAA